MIDLVARSFDSVVHAGVRLFLNVMGFLEQSLRAPLQSIGIHGVLQTLILMMIPIAMIVAAVKLLGGVARTLMVIMLVLVLVHVAWPIMVSPTY